MDHKNISDSAEAIEPAETQGEEDIAEATLEDPVASESQVDETHPDEALSKDSGREEDSLASDATPVYIGLVIGIVFILGLGIGFFGRPLLLKDLPIEVVVTVVPEQSQTIVQTNPQTNKVETQAQASTAMSDDEALTDKAEAGDSAMPTPTIMDFVLSDARHFQGDEDAPVTVVEFSDFNCGFCGRFATETLNQLRANYVETGKIRFAYKHFAILGPSSGRAAEASECAAEQDKFWDFHDTTFANRVAGLTDLSDDSLIAQAADLGLNMDDFSECLTSNKYANQIRQESLSVQSMGVRGTPGFLINGIFISGAQPFDVFQEVIEEQLVSLE